MIFDRRGTPGETIRALRVVRGFTLGDVAEQLGTSKATISRYENGSRQMTVDRFGEILKILSADYLVRF